MPEYMIETDRRTREAGAQAVHTVSLPYRPPYNWPMVLAFFEQRTIPRVEWVRDGRYGRTIALNGHTGWFEVRHDPDNNRLIADVYAADAETVKAVAGRLRRQFDLDTDMAPIEATLTADPLFRDKVQLHPGLRMPGAWDEFELAARAILGQQVSVAAARTLAGRLAVQFGQAVPVAAVGSLAPAPFDDPPLLFPTPAALAGQDLTAIGLPQARARALAGLAAAVVEEPDLLSPLQDPRQAVARLVRLPGIGPWTAEYIAMRALRDADAFPASDLGLLVGAAHGGPRPKPAELTRRAERWRPWRAYAAIHLWTMPTDGR